MGRGTSTGYFPFATYADFVEKHGGVVKPCGLADLSILGGWYRDAVEGARDIEDHRD